MIRPRLVSKKSCGSCLVISLLLVAACRGERGRPGAAGTAPRVPLSGSLGPDDDLPGINPTVVAVRGGSAPGGGFRSGDVLEVDFQVTLDDGTPVDLADLDAGRIMVSGPTFHYQPVIPLQADLLTASRPLRNDTWRYRFPLPLPKVYQAPLNDSPQVWDGEWAGLALVAGTYTVGIEVYKDFTAGTSSYRDAGNALADFLFGGATTLDPRDVVGQDNCNQCHTDLQVHGGTRRDVGHCLLCHTAGSEDRNNPAVAGGTPGVTIDFDVMIHRIHNGAHLPSVLGVGTFPDGTRDYSKTPAPYLIVGFRDSIHDFSDVHYPRWPSLTNPMPRDFGYSMLPSSSQSQEDEMRSGVVDCASCHGDPDDAGPLEAPTQGDLAYLQPGRDSCGSCHDDIDWDLPYVSNLQSMPAQGDDATCILCHASSGDPLAVADAHRHPLVDPAVNQEPVITVTSVDEAGNNDGDGTVDVGEGVAVGFTLTDASGGTLDPSLLTRFEVVINGPTGNPNLILLQSLNPAILGPGPSHVMTLPEVVQMEFVGDSTPAGGESFPTARAPHWVAPGGSTVVNLRTSDVASGSLGFPAQAEDNFLDLMPGEGALFARNDVIVVDDSTGQEEYVTVQWVEGDRLWLSSAYTSSYKATVQWAHPAGATVTAVTLSTLTPGVDYLLDADNGIITEVTEFGSGVAVLVTYTTDFSMPAVYRGALNESPDLDETFGDWVGKSLVSGTYTVGLHGATSITVTAPGGEMTGYRSPSQPGTMDFLVGSATTLSGNDRIESADSCNACHGDIYFHGNSRRGYDTCVLCHGSVAAEDRPRYVAANAPDTTGVSVEFRAMLHKIHQGEELANATTYQVIGFGSGYPNNFSVHTYDEVVYPAHGGTADCRSCHGSSDAFQQPVDRSHPTEKTVAVMGWQPACGSCHDSSAAVAHMQTQVGNGGEEACAVCHGPGKPEEVELKHKVR